MSEELEQAYKELFEQLSLAGQYFVDSVVNAEKNPLIIDNGLIICGMGGSGISGDYIKKLSEGTDIPVVVSKNYQVPAYIDDSWDAVVISYSGNTEETLSSLKQLINIGIKPTCISSNGELQEITKIENLKFIEVQQGIQPRAAFPLLFGSLYGLVAHSLELPSLTDEIKDRIVQGSKIKIQEELDHVATMIQTKLPIIVYPRELSCNALRFRCQLNENSKLPAAIFEAPEFSHNGIVAFDGKRGSEQAIILLRTDEEFERTSIHLDFLRDNMGNAGFIHEFKVYSESNLEEILKLTWILDYVSIAAAQIQGVDPLGVPSIDKLKAILKK